MRRTTVIWLVLVFAAVLNKGASLQTHAGFLPPYPIAVANSGGDKRAVIMAETTLHTVDIAASAVSALAWSPSGNLMAIVYAGGPTTCVPGGPVASYYLELVSSAGVLTQTLSGANCKLADLAFSYDEQYIVTQSEAGRIQIMETEALTIVYLLETMSSGIGLVASPSEQRFVLIQNNSSASIHELVVNPDLTISFDLTNSINTFSEHHSDLIMDADWDPTGTMIATSSDDTTVAIWHIGPETLLHRIMDPSSRPVRKVAWSPTGNRVAFANDVHQITIWDGNSESIQNNFVAHGAAINRLEWSPDGTRLASASEDGTVKVWNVDTGPLLETLTYPGPVYALDWSPDSTKIAYGGADLSGSLPQVQLVDAPVTEAMFEAMLEAEAERNRVSCLSDHARPARLTINEEVEVVEDGADLRLRVSPDLSSTVLQTMAGGTLVTIVGGPACSGGYRWWQVQLRDGTVGWAVEADSSDYFLLPSSS